MHSEALAIEFIEQLKGISVEDDIEFNFFELGGSGYLENPTTDLMALEGANKQVISSQADSLIKISRIWADFFPANTSNQPI